MAGSERSGRTPLAERFEAEALPHIGLLYQVARRLCRSAPAAEDLVQETYLKAYQAFARYEPRSFGIRPWLLRILNNTFLNHAARDQRERRSTDLAQAADNTAPSAGAGDDGRIDLQQVDDELVRALDDLSPEYRAVVLLWATMEFGYQEMADILEVPVGTVMSRLHRARHQLRESLAEYAARIGRAPAADA